MADAAEVIKAEIEDILGESVMILTNLQRSPNAVFFISKREGIYPFLVRGFCNKRKEVFPMFTACNSLEAAQSRLTMIVSNLN